MKLIIILCIILLSCAHAQTVTWVASTKVYGGNSCSNQADCEAKCGADTTCEGWSTISSSVIAARNTNWCDSNGCKGIYGYLNGNGNFMASYPGGCSCSSSSCTYNSYCGHSWHNTCNTGGKQCYGPTTVYSYTYGTATADTGGNSQLVAERDGICGTNYHVVSNACVACGIGLLNAMGDDKSGADTTCNAVPCAVNEHVVSGICTACATGYIRDAGDDPTAGNTQCTSTFCAVNEKVVSNACVPCPAGKDNADGTSDSYLLADTTCDVIYCPTNQKVVSNVCTACEPGMENVAGDDATGADTTCEPTYCAADHKVVNHVCTPCGLGTNVAGDDASQGNTVCEEPTYEASTKVYSGSTCSNDIDCQNKCAADSNCEGYSSVTTSVIGPRNSNWCDQEGCKQIKGYLNGFGNFMMSYPGGCSCTSGQWASCTYNSYCGKSWHTTCNKGGKQCYGPSTSTSWSYGPETAADGGTSFKLISTGQECGENFRVQNGACVACVAPATNAKGDHVGGGNTACDCAAGYVVNTNTNLCDPIVCNENERVNDQSQCVACGAGTLREAGDKASDGETQCYPTPDSSIALRSLNEGHDIIDQNCLGIKIVDYDDDGKLDIIYYNRKQSGCNVGNNYIEYYRNTGTNVNPNYVKTKVLARSNSVGNTPWSTQGVKDIHVYDFDNDGIKDILTEGTTYLLFYAQHTNRNLLFKGHATEFLQISNGNDHIWQAQGPFSLADLNGDGYIDLMASGGQEAIKYYFNKADGTIGFNLHSSYRGKCWMGKYQLIAGKPEVAIIQGSNLEGSTGWQNQCPSLSSDPRWRLELTTRVGLGSWSYLGNISPQPTAVVNEAKWVDFDNDGDDELVVLTDNELNLYSFTSTQSIDYPNTINNVNLNSTVISSHANENDAKAACDADSECKAIQLTTSGQWEAIKGDLAYIEAGAGTSATACRTATTSDARNYLPKSCSDTSKEDGKFYCLAQFGSSGGTQFTVSGNSDDYWIGANLGKVEPTSLNEVPAACQFDSSTDAENPDNIETCLLTAGNMYVKACADDSECEATAILSGDGSGYMQRTLGRKQIGDKWVLVTVKLHRGTELQHGPGTTVKNGCYDSMFGVNKPYDIRMYRVETSATPAGKVKLKVINSAVTGSSGVKLDAYASCSICGRVMNEIIVADVKKIGTPQLILIDSARSGSTAYLVTVGKSSGSWTSEINDLKTLVPAVATATLGQITSDTFRSLTSSGFTVNSVLARGATSMSSSIVSYPISCAVNERTVNGVCEACPTGSTSNGVSDPMASPNTGCVRVDNTCLENEYVKNNQCFKCVSPETNAAGDDASGPNTACDCVNTYAPCEGGIERYTGTCDGVADKTCGGAGGGTCVGSFGSCDANSKKIWSNTEVPADGNMSSCKHPSGYVASCECNGAQYADNGVCRACPVGATANLVNYDTSLGDTVCLCQGEMGSDGSVCYPCPTGRTNALKDYDPTSGVKECVVTSCAKDQYVSNHVCTACPHNSQRLPGDDPAGPDTRCHCRINSKVIGGDCMACETGSTNPKLCYASKEGGDTYCTCDENYYAAASKTCTECPANSKNEAGDYAGDGPTYCNCKEGYHVESGTCKKCQDNSLSIGNDELDGGDTYCTCAKDYYASSGTCTACPANTFNDAPTKSNVDGTCKCNANFKVKNNACVACELTSTRVGGSVMSGPDTYCICGVNEKVISNECVACETGASLPGTRDAAGVDQQCICDAGYQKNAATKLCEACPAGTDSYSPHGADAPCLCKSGYYVKTPGTCEVCPTGSTSDGGNDYNVVSTCIVEAGYYVDSSGDVQACPAGSTSLGGELVNAGQTKCTTEANHYVDTNGDVQDCPANSAVPGGILLEARATISGCICNKGFQAVGAACGQCPNGQTTDGTHRTDEAQRGCHCKEGYYVDDTDHSCKECSVGGSTAEGGDPNGAATSCDCAANYRVNANAQCELCGPGETNAPLDQTQGGETQCDITYCNTNQRVENHACVTCPTGMINEKDDPANSVNTICDYKGDAEDQYEFDISGTKFLVQKKDGTNLGLNPKLTLRISEGPFTFSRQPASTAGDDLVIAEAVTWATPNVAYDTYVQLASLEAVDDVKVAVWEPNLPGTFYYLSKDTNTMVGEIEVTLPLCVIGTSGNTQLQNSCILPNEITLTGDLDISVTTSRRRFLRKNLKSGEILVQAAANSRHFSVPAGTTLTINGFTLSDGNPGDAGGSILASGGSVVAEGVTFKNNKGTTGGAIEAEKDQANNEPSVSIKSSTFDNNEGTGGGGAINAKAGAFIVEGTTFKNNKAPNGDGGALASVTDVTIKTSVFESNSAPTGSGGAVTVDGKKLTMSDTTMKSNEAQNGGALNVKEGEADLQTITVESNTATSDGGAILVDKSDVTIASSNIKENNGANGGGIKTKNMNGKRLEANSNTFNGNKGTSGGGAFHFEDESGADITIFESSFMNNKGAADENDDMKAAGTANLKVKMVDMLTEIVRKAMPPPDCSTVSCGHRTKSIAKARTDGSCKCACDGINEYEKDRQCTAITVCGPGEVSVVDPSDESDRICGSQTIKDKQAEFDAAGAALSSLVTNKLKESGLGDSDAFNLAVDMVGGVNKC